MKWIAASSLLLFLLITLTRHDYDTINHDVLTALRASDSLLDLAIVFAIVGDSYWVGILTAAAAIIFILMKRRRDAVLLTVIVTVGCFANAGLKLIIQEPRPAVYLSPYPAGGFSFPSGHAQAAVALYGTIALLSRRWWIVIPCVVMIIGIVWCRLALGVHRPTEVIAGMLVGTFTIASCVLLPSLLGRGGGG